MSAKKPRLSKKKLPPSVLNDRAMLDVLDGPPARTLGESNLEPYQWFMSDRMVEETQCYVAAEMGLGKTGATLHAITRLFRENKVRKVLIVAPLYVANETWPDELRVWEFARELSFSILTGDDEDRATAAQQDTQIHIINREKLVWLWSLFGARNWPYDMLVYDEAGRLKAGEPVSKKNVSKTKTDENGKPLVSGGKLNEFGMLARARGLFSRVVELSGTPAPNGLIDLWGPFYILDRGQSLGVSKTGFKARWFTENKYSHEIKPQPHAFSEIMERIKPRTIALRSDDYLSLPPMVERDIEVVLPSSVREKYQEMERQYYLEDYDVEAVNDGVLANKLLQMANGSIYDADGKDIPLHDVKLEALERIQDEANGKPLLIAYSFAFDRDRIKRKFPKFRVFGESASDMRDWNAGRISGMLMHPASASHGLNFQFGSNVAVWYGLNWSLELYQQFNARLRRRGQASDRVWLYRILARDTYDHRQLKNLTRKDATQEKIKESVRYRRDDLAKMGYV